MNSSKMTVMPSWDVTGDGIVDSSDLIGSYDLNNDGLLDKAELDAIGSQLSNQLAFNNELLLQLQEMNESQLSAQREVQEKQDNIQKLMQANLEYKNDVNETKRKLRILQEIVESMTKQARDRGGEFNVLRQELDLANKQSNDSNITVQNLTEEKARLEKSYQQCQVQLADAKLSISRISVSSIGEIESLKRDNAQSTAMLADLRKKLVPLDLENQDLRAHVQELTRSLADCTSKLEKEFMERSAVNKQLKEALASAISSKALQADAQYKLESIQEKETDAVKKYTALEGLNKTLQSRIGISEKEVVELHNEIDHFHEEVETLHHEIDSLHRDLDTLSRQRTNENDIWMNKYVALQSELAASQEESKDRQNAAVADAKRRVTEAVDDRKRAEEQFHIAYKSNVELHDSLEELRVEHQKATESWSVTNREYEENLLLLRRQMSAKDADIEAMHVLAAKEKLAAAKSITDLKRELMLRPGSFVETMSKAQDMVKALQKEMLDGKSRLRDLSSQTQLLLNFCLQLQTKLQISPVSRLQPELKRVFEVLFEKMASLRGMTEEAHDEIALLQVTAEEEKNRALICEEEISKLEHTISMAQADTSSELNKCKQRLEEALNSTKVVQADKLDMEERFQRMQAALELATTQNNTLQASHKNLHAVYKDAVTKASQPVVTSVLSDEKVTQLTALLNQAEREKLQGEERTKNLVIELSLLKEKFSVVSADAEALRSELVNRDKNLATSKGEFSQALTKVTANGLQYEQQLKQTQDILKVMQVQRNELQSQNQELRKEIDRLYNKADTGTSETSESRLLPLAKEQQEPSENVNQQTEYSPSSSSSDVHRRKSWWGRQKK